VEFIEARFESTQVAERLEEILNEHDSRLTFAVCCDEDSSSLTVALELKAMLKERGRQATIVNRMASNGGLTALICDKKSQPTSDPPQEGPTFVEGICPFGMLETLSMPGEK
jgi:galactitol-specific phosphotransferase system IIB component